MDGTIKKLTILDSNIVLYYYRLNLKLPSGCYFFSGLLDELKTVELDYIKDLTIIEYCNTNCIDFNISKKDNIFLNYANLTDKDLTIVTNDKKLKRALKKLKSPPVTVMCINDIKMLSPGFEPELRA